MTNTGVVYMENLLLIYILSYNIVSGKGSKTQITIQLSNSYCNNVISSSFPPLLALIFQKRSLRMES